MITAVTGTVSGSGEGFLRVDVNGVEFTLEASQNCVSKFSSSAPAKVRIPTVFQVREDSMTLFGFLDEAERDCFNELVKVPGIAGKGALKILSSITVNDLVKALDQRDVGKLSRIPGVGGKTAQKLILQLRDTLVYTDDDTSASTPTRTNAREEWDDVVESLAQMGFDKKNVLKALDKLLEKEGAEIAKLEKTQAEGQVFSRLLRSLS